MEIYHPSELKNEQALFNQFKLVSSKLHQLEQRIIELEKQILIQEMRGYWWIGG